MKSGDRYQLLEKIASGSFATVYRAHDQELGREVAVKQIHEQFLGDPRQLDRYWGEAQLLASLQHPNIVTIYDIVREKGWLIMELMQGNLADRMQGRPMDLVALRTVLAHCLRALKFLHEHGVVHGDIKPSNMLVDRRKRLKLGDFGLARRVSDEEGSLIKGTTKYMAPEVVSDEFGDVGPASDLYSLGFAAYELMCGNNFDSLFPGLNAHGRDKQLAWIMWHAAADRRLPPIARVLEGVPEDLAKVIQKLATKNPAQRYKTADEALTDLNVDLRVIRAEEQGDGGPPVDPAARRKRLLTIGAFAASMLTSALLFFMVGEETPKPKSPSGLIRDVRVEPREIVVIDEVTGIPETIKVGEKPSFLLKDPLKKTQEKILLEEVHPGDRVRIKQQGGRVEFVLLRPVTTPGKILRLDGVAKVVVIETDDGVNREEIPIQVSESPKSKITVNGRSADFNDLQEHDRVDIQHLANPHDENRQIALSVAARRSVRATGFVRTLNWQGKKLSFDVRQGTGSKMLDYPFAKDALITLPNGKTVGPADLKADDLRTADRVSVEYDTEITRVVASRNQTLTGTVMSINGEAKTVVIQTRDGNKHSLVITPETEIDVGGELARFDELREYDEARATYQEHDDGSGQHAITIDATRPAKHDRLAIVIGIQHYDDKSVPRTSYILDDVDLLADALRHRYCVAQERLLILKDADKSRVEKDVTRVLHDALAQTHVVVYFEGQAYAGADGKFYLAPRDFQKKNPEQSGLELEWLVKLMETCASTDKLLILDTFQVENIEKADTQPSPTKMLESVADSIKTFQAIAARSEDEKGQLFPEKHVGSFAWQTAQGFKGAADEDHDLYIKPHELQKYLAEQLPKLSFDKMRPQTPKLFEPRP